MLGQTEIFIREIKKVGCNCIKSVFNDQGLFQAAEAWLFQASSPETILSI